MIKKILLLYGLILILTLTMYTTTENSLVFDGLKAQNYTDEGDPSSWSPCPLCHCKFDLNGDCCCGGVAIHASMPCYCIDCHTSYSCSEGHNCPNHPEGGNNEPTITYNGDGSSSGGGSYYQYQGGVMDANDWIDYIMNNYSIFTRPPYTPPGGVTYVVTKVVPIPRISVSAVVSKTTSYVGGQYKRGTERPVTLQSQVFDCSAWVYFVLLNINPDVANDLGTNTSLIQAYCESHGGYHSKPVVGDLAVWAGHVEFVVGFDIYGGYVTINGSRGSAGDPIPTSIGSGWLTYTTMYQIAPNFKGFWTIH